MEVGVFHTSAALPTVRSPQYPLHRSMHVPYPVEAQFIMTLLNLMSSISLLSVREKATHYAVFFNPLLLHFRSVQIALAH